MRRRGGSILCCWSQQRDEKEANSDSRICSASALPEGICRRFSLAEIKAATNNFHRDSIIRYGFGPVYKGTVDDGNGTMVAVAVKCYLNGYLLENVTEFFRNEVRILCQLRHPNLISMIGFCEDQNEMIVVYEYMSKGSLSDHLYGGSHLPLSWKQRLEVCIGAARGLHYLHTEAKYALLHNHIKSYNIRLYEEMKSCKLDGFAFSKMGPLNISNVSMVKKESKLKGTNGYMAPEYVSFGELTEKSDVYSFGIVLFEVLLGRKAYDDTLPENQQNILEWASEFIRKGTFYRVIDPYLKGKIAPECFKKYMEIACSCVRYNRNERPATGEVEVTLEQALELQEKANSESQGIYPQGECTYEESSFSTSNSYFEFGLDRYSSKERGHILLTW